MLRAWCIGSEGEGGSETVCLVVSPTSRRVLTCQLFTGRGSLHPGFTVEIRREKNERERERESEIASERERESEGQRERARGRAEARESRRG